MKRKLVLLTGLKTIILRKRRGEAVKFLNQCDFHPRGWRAEEILAAGLGAVRYEVFLKRQRHYS